MKTLFKTITLVILLLTLSTITSKAYEFPIPELGNCQNRRECHLFCEIPQNRAACWSYSTYENQVLGDESPEQKVSALGIQFPIKELGNCPNIGACKAYCEADENNFRCQAFAQKTGLANGELITEQAKEELGCTSKEECHTFCEKAENREACTAFSNRYHLKGAVKEKLLEEAKKALGCSSYDECKTTCAQKEKRDQCQSLGKKFNTNSNSKREALVEVAKQELGCSSYEDCKAFCQNEANRDTCRNFGQKVSEGAQLRNLQNKGICNTVEECKQICTQTPDKCPGFPNKNSDSQPGSLEFKRSTEQYKSLNTRPALEKRLESKSGSRLQSTPPNTKTATSDDSKHVEETNTSSGTSGSGQ